MSKDFHSFHIVDLSPWPLINSLNLMNLLASMIFKFNENKNTLNIIILLSFMFMILSMFLWWRDITREASHQGFHTTSVYLSMKISMLLFIASEIMFFLGFFWSYFNFSLAPSMETGNNWPPIGIQLINPFQIPLLNTIILLSSGSTITWSHHCILNKNFKICVKSMILTILLAFIFILLQIFEFKTSTFTISSSIYGSLFFLTTGFHGMHVMVGTTFIVYNLNRIINSQLNNKHHFSFEASAWYWHFVDIVWIYLFVFVYWWFN